MSSTMGMRYESAWWMAMTPRERAQRMAILPQTLPAPAVSVAELAVFGRNPYLDFGRRMTPTDRRLVEEALERVGIAALRDKLLTELSGGERQKAYLAMILAQDTDVLLLDEPTTYMDMEYEAAFFRLLKALQAEKGVTLLVILHDLSQAMRYADRIVVLDAGRVRFAGDTRACAAGGVLEAVFRVRQRPIADGDGEWIFFTPEG